MRVEKGESIDLEKEALEFPKPPRSEERTEDLHKVEEVLQYRFKDLELLDVAFTHRSYVRENLIGGKFCNQRLEFLGDGILEGIIAHVLFQQEPGSEEGILSRKKSLVVKGASLAEIGRDMNILPYLLRSNGMQVMNTATESAVLADLIEAIIGAIFVDSGYESAKTFIKTHFAQKIRETLSAIETRDYRSLLIERVTARDLGNVNFRVVDERGPDHEKEFFVEVWLGKRKLAEAWGRSKKMAARAASEKALKYI